MMKRILCFILLLTCVVGSNAQNKKIKEAMREARTPGDSNYVVLRNGERKPIKSAKLSIVTLKLKIEFADGKKETFKTGQLDCYQDDDGFYVNIPNTPAGARFIDNIFMAYRVVRGAINVYHMEYTWHKTGQMQTTSDMAIYMESATGKYEELFNDSSVVNRVAELTAKSNAAMEKIKAIRADYGKMKWAGSMSGRLTEVIQVYNKDVAEGKLQD